jgi:hypothetical protein
MVRLSDIGGCTCGVSGELFIVEDLTNLNKRFALGDEFGEARVGLTEFGSASPDFIYSEDKRSVGSWGGSDVSHGVLVVDSGCGRGCGRPGGGCGSTWRGIRGTGDSRVDRGAEGRSEVFAEGAGLVSGDMFFPGEPLLEAQETRGGAVAMCAFVFGASDIAMIFVNGGKVGASALGTSEEDFRPFAIRDRVSEAKAAATLEEGGVVLEGADGGLAAKEIGGRATHELEAIPIGVMEGEDDAGMMFASKVFFASEPSWFGEDAAACTNSIFHKFSAKDRGGDGVRVGVANDRNPTQNYLAVTLSRGRAAIRAEWSEKNVIILRNGVEGGFPF